MNKNNWWAHPSTRVINKTIVSGKTNLKSRPAAAPTSEPLVASHVLVVIALIAFYLWIK